MPAKRWLAALLPALLFSACQTQPTTPQPAATPKMESVESTQISFDGAPPPEGLRSVTLTWDDCDSGDCHQSSGTLMFRADGTAQWSSTVWTDSPHEMYWHSSFEVRDKNGAPLFTLPAITGPQMDKSHSTPHLHFDHDYTFDPAKLEQIAKAVQHYGC